MEVMLDNLLYYAKKLVISFFLFVIVYYLQKLGKKIIRKLLRATKRFDLPEERLKGRLKTIIRLLEDLYTATLYFLAIYYVLQLWNINVAPLLAGAGVIGLAIGFGSKELVKDLVYGFFILFDAEYNVGDFIEAAGFKGKVVNIGIRTTILKGPDGAKYVIPNGQITKVAVYTKKPPWLGPKEKTD